MLSLSPAPSAYYWTGEKVKDSLHNMELQSVLPNRLSKQTQTLFIHLLNAKGKLLPNLPLVHSLSALDCLNWRDSQSLLVFLEIVQSVYLTPPELFRLHMLYCISSQHIKKKTYFSDS